ncbi:sporulation protein [Streptomyces sp. NPDC016459]|uniref:sporulation protein n=1 Tax=Streptomyces sp. NPDC016459 TaxID=3157190 RepID=UPI0034103E0E
MVFKRLLGSKNKGGPSIPLVVDTVIADEPVQPGGMLRGEVVLRAPDREVRVRDVKVKLVVNASPALGKDTEVDTESGDVFGIAYPGGAFTVGKGEEVRIPLRYRLKWETPVSEVHGERVEGVRLAAYTEVESEGIEDRTDSDPLHIAATPLHEAVLDAFAAAGYSCGSAQIDPLGHIPRAERQLSERQSFRLVDTLAVQGLPRPQHLEVTFVTNPVGAEIYVRKAALHQKEWARKPPYERYAAAHHEVGQRDFEADVNRWIEEVAALPDKREDPRLERVQYDLGSPREWAET